MPVVLEVLDDNATGPAEGDKSSRRSDIAKLADVIVRRERRRRNQPFFRHTIRVRSEHHVRDVEEPLIKERILWIGRRIGKESGVALGRFRSTQLLFVHALALNREDADI